MSSIDKGKNIDCQMTSTDLSSGYTKNVPLKIGTPREYSKDYVYPQLDSTQVEQSHQTTINHDKEKCSTEGEKMF